MKCKNTAKLQTTRHNNFSYLISQEKTYAFCVDFLILIFFSRTTWNIISRNFRTNKTKWDFFCRQDKHIKIDIC